VTGSGDAVSVTGVAQVSKAASAATCRAAEMAASQGRLVECGERSLAAKAGSSRPGRIAAMSKPPEAEAEVLWANAEGAPSAKPAAAVNEKHAENPRPSSCLPRLHARSDQPQSSFCEV
jgi:hypothetical protein